jgi:hypothetical protein
MRAHLNFAQPNLRQVSSPEVPWVIFSVAARPTVVYNRRALKTHMLLFINNILKKSDAWTGTGGHNNTNNHPPNCQNGGTIDSMNLKNRLKSAPDDLYT